MQAFAAIALAAVACDGELERREAQGLRQQLENRTPYADLSEEAMGDLLDQLLELVRDQGCGALIQTAVPVLSPPQRETALAMAAQLTRADQQVSPQESTFLQQLGQLMELEAGRAEQILEVIAVLNRDSLAG
jgi:hypothetical protein